MGVFKMEETRTKRRCLSLILCSRNDEYMGNSRWRLQTTLNHVADQVEALGRAKDVEVFVGSWCEPHNLSRRNLAPQSATCSSN
jgi:hypothetical protein